MKKKLLYTILLSTLLFTIISVPQAVHSTDWLTSPPDSEWFGQDKFIHFGISTLIYLGSYYLIKDIGKIDRTQARYYALIPPVLAGFGKEIYDTRPGGSGADYKDLVADTSGIIIGFGVTFFW